MQGPGPLVPVPIAAKDPVPAPLAAADNPLIKAIRALAEKYKTRVPLDIPYAEVCRDPDQPRQYFNTEAMTTLIESIKLVGQIDPGLVVSYRNEAVPAARYKIVDGERRWRARGVLGHSVYSAHVLDEEDTGVLFGISMMKNFNHEGHTPMEKALGFQRLKGFGLSQVEISALVGESQFNVSRYLKLTKLTAEVRELVATEAGEDTKKTGKLATQVAVMVADLPSELQFKAANEVLGASVATATTYLRRFFQDAGVERRTRQEQPARFFQVMINRLERMIAGLDIYDVDQAANFVATMRARTPGERARMKETLLRISKKAERLAEKIPKN